VNEGINRIIGQHPRFVSSQPDFEKNESRCLLNVEIWLIIFFFRTNINFKRRTSNYICIEIWRFFRTSFVPVSVPNLSLT